MDDTLKMMMKVLLTICSTFLHTECTHIQITPLSLDKGGNGRRGGAPFLVTLPPFGEQFHFSGLNGSETSSAKIPLSFPFLPSPQSSLPLLLILLPSLLLRATAIY